MIFESKCRSQLFNVRTLVPGVACISNYIPQNTAGYQYLSMPEIPASGTKVLICRDHSVYAPSQWEMRYTVMLSHWLDTLTELSLLMCCSRHWLHALLTWKLDCQAAEKKMSNASYSQGLHGFLDAENSYIILQRWHICIMASETIDSTVFLAACSGWEKLENCWGDSYFTKDQ